ncbi:PKD domain-containing protein [Agreia sp. VKM Ac-1783]|uniref:PKD domain-containing protein n=1 Tax=Agreia sp. VKM Ac-1783 TaxID=1938889 RepID=UPI000A2AC47C|nr:PKD domain-containing protein [Agreia sp. VKM Ac-1783]SMQ58294.1 PKD repeat-containing protein [Agreia sp. VKM Ac-1783]
MAKPRRLRARAFFVLTTAVAVVAATLTASPAFADSKPLDPTSPASPTTVSADALPTVQIDGVVWQQVIVGDTVYAAGKFTTARPAGSAPGVNTVPRNNILAYSLSTGNLITSFAPSLNAEAFSIAASPDGSRIYVGGSFTQVNGSSVWRIAALNPTTGALITSFLPKPAGPVRAIAATSTSVFMGGLFSSVGTEQRPGVAEASAANGALTAFAPQVTGGRVNGLVLSPDASQLIIGGQFTAINGSSNPGYGLGSVSTADGSLLPFATNNTVRNGNTQSAITSLSRDGDSFYGTGYVFGSGGNLEGAFRANFNGGTIDWIEDCHGDSYAVKPIGDVVYVASHSHYCGNIGGFPQTDPWGFHRALAFSKTATGTVTQDIYGYPSFTGNPAPSLLNWFPDLDTGTATGQNQGPWAVDGTSKYVVMGGEFKNVNNTAQQGLVRFAVSSIAPNAQGPRVTGARFNPTLTSTVSGTVRIRWAANWDRDNSSMKYEVFRDGNTTTPIYTTTAESSFYNLPAMGYVDKGLVPGKSYRYRVFATDPFGNIARSDSVSITATATGQSDSAYSTAVMADAPSEYYRLGDAPGTTVEDWAGFNDATVNGPVDFGSAGMDASNGNTAIGLTGSGYLTTPKAEKSPNNFTVESWVKTTSTDGGKIIGFGNAATGTSGSYDRQVYMGNDGKIWFGVYTGNTATVTSSKPYNDGEWHHVAATLSPAGMKLVVDGKVVGSRTDVTQGQDFTGYWRVGGDNLSGWPGQPNNSYLTGNVDEVAIYGAALSQDQLVAHYVASGRVSPIPAAPADAYGASVFNLDPTLYWRLGENSGPVAVDSSKSDNPGDYTGLVTPGVDGALSGVTNTAAKFEPVDNGGWQEAGISSATQFNNPNTYALELWFKTTTTRGGKLIGFGANKTGGSSGYDRHVYMENDGRLTFGTWTGQTNTITTPSAYNDGKWHYMSASQSSAGLKLFVDGALSGTNPQTQAQDYNGYWRVGGDTTWGNTAPYFAGTIDEVAVYPRALTSDEVKNHYDLGAGVVPNVKPVASFSSVVTDLDVAFDASGSVDQDGTVTSYAWDFGDGGTATGATPVHHYADAGDHSVVLTVTDNTGATDTVQHTITTVLPNVPPVASFNTVATGLSLAVDASSASDSDGSITGYAWDFGDGTTATGVTSGHVFAAGGTFPVTLSVTDNRGAVVTATQSVTITAPPANVAPTAAFTNTAVDLAASFDATTSSDADGTVASYAWAFGDGSTGTGATTSHSYAAAGTFSVVLTVTDNAGATGTVTKSVTVTAPPVQPSPTLATDAFGRSVTGGLGTADVGGAWSVTGGTANASVSGGKAQLKATKAGANVAASLAGVSSTSTNTLATFSLSAVPNGGGGFISVAGRQVSPGTDYRARVKVGSNGAMTLYIGKTVAGAETTLKTVNLVGSYVANTDYVIRTEVQGSGTTTIRAKAWAKSQAEPANWQATIDDTTSALQAPGTVGLMSYLSGSSTNFPLVTSFDDLSATTIGAVVTPPAPTNAVPVAAFVSSSAGLTASVDGSSSTDSDGSIVSYAWNFGDGATATGATASHAYAASGTYTVQLTVADNAGATATLSNSVTVTSPAAPVDPNPGAALATDAFERAASAGFGSADAGGAWTVNGGAANASVAGGKGILSFSKGGAGLNAFLPAVSSTRSNAVVNFSTDKLDNGSGQYVSLAARQVSAGNDYRGKVKVAPNGAMTLYLGKTVGGTETTLKTLAVPGTYVPGTEYSIRVQAVGSTSTTLSAKLWPTGQQEPTDWQVTVDDTTAGLQAAGGVALITYLSGSTTNFPIRVSFDNLSVAPVL